MVPQNPQAGRGVHAKLPPTNPKAPHNSATQPIPTLPMNRITKIPLVGWILIALVLASGFGWLAGEKNWDIQFLKKLGDLVLDGLRALSTPLIFVAVVLAIYRANIEGRKGGVLIWLILSNTLVAILIGLTVANLLQPGVGADLVLRAGDAEKVESVKQFSLMDDLLKKIVPSSLLAPFVKNDLLPVVFLAILSALAMRKLRSEGSGVVAGLQTSEALMDTIYQVVLKLLHWLFFLVPPAVFAVVATTVAKEGFASFRKFGFFVLAVLLALLLQACWYLFRLRINSWVKVGLFLKSGAEAFAMGFSTASSVATLSVTYRSATEKMGLREENARLGTMVGGNINNDGTALYEAMAALFVAQMLGMNLGIGEQILLVLMAVVASVGAAGIPEAGLVTMVAVFTAVGLPPDYIPLLLTVDWFLDRCRTAVNIMGDLTVSAILDGKIPADQTKALPGPA